MVIAIQDRKIGNGYPPFVIAELSANHNGNIETAKKIIEEAKKSGADAVKLQTYKPDTITLDCESSDFVIESGLWVGRTLYDLYSEAHLPWEWHKPLFDHAKKVGITIFSSPFDSTAIDLLEDLNVPAYKIASFEAVDIPLIKYAASTGKPLIISTGMADSDEIAEAVDAAREEGCSQIAILHCVSGYPAPPEDYNLSTIPDMIERFECVVGLSDHTLGVATAVAGVGMGASIVEKHFTLDRRGGGPDDSFSLEPNELVALCEGCSIAWKAKGQVNYARKSSENQNAKFRRSLYFVEDLQAGQVITATSIRSVRPGFGMAPKFFNEIVGRKVIKPVAFGDAVSKDLLGD